MARKQFIKDRARRILQEFGLTEPSVPIEEIIESYALKIEEVWRDARYDGELIPELRVIRINRNKPKTRQRFTLAHELGHWVLFHQHRLFEDEQEGFEKEDGRPLFDKLADDVSAEKEEKETGFERAGSRKTREQEANIFAAEILMPTQWVRADWRTYKQDVNGLAKRYEVSDDAMWIKVMELGLIK